MNNKQRFFFVTLLLPFTATPVYAAFEGTLESVNCDVIKGWAWNNTQPTTRIKIDIYDVAATKTTQLTIVM